MIHYSWIAPFIIQSILIWLTFVFVFVPCCYTCSRKYQRLLDSQGWTAPGEKSRKLKWGTKCKFVFSLYNQSIVFWSLGLFVNVFVRLIPYFLMKEVLSPISLEPLVNYTIMLILILDSWRSSPSNLTQNKPLHWIWKYEIIYSSLGYVLLLLSFLQ